MMPMSRQEIEILLDSPESRDYVVSAYADMTIKNGFVRDVELHLKNEAKAAAKALSGTGAAKDLKDNLEVIRRIITQYSGEPIRGLAVFSARRVGSVMWFRLISRSRTA